MSAQTELAWAAGFFEGEGCISILRRHDLAQPRLRLEVGQKRPDVLERWRSAVGTHRPVNGPRANGMYAVTAEGAEAHRILDALESYFTERGAKLTKYHEARTAGCRPEKMNRWHKEEVRP